MKRIMLMFVVLIFVVATLPAFGQEMVRRADGPARFENNAVPITDRAIIDKVRALDAVSASEDPTPIPAVPTPYGVVIAEHIDDERRTRVDFVVTDEIPVGVLVFKKYQTSDGTSLFLPAWEVNSPIGPGTGMTLWDGDLRVIFGQSYLVEFSVVFFNTKNGEFSRVSTTVNPWGGQVHRLPRVLYAYADEGAIRVRLESGDSLPTFLLDGFVVPQGAVVGLGNGEYRIFSSPEVPFYEADRLLTVRVGEWSDSIRFRFTGGGGKG